MIDFDVQSVTRNHLFQMGKSAVIIANMVANYQDFRMAKVSMIL